MNETTVEVAAALARDVLTEKTDAMRNAFFKLYRQGLGWLFRGTLWKNGDGFQGIQEGIPVKEALENRTCRYAALAPEEDGPAGVLQSISKVLQETLVV